MSTVRYDYLLLFMCCYVELSNRPSESSHKVEANLFGTYKLVKNVRKMWNQQY